MHAYHHGAGRARVLYLFRSPSNVKVGRQALDGEVTEALEHTHPDYASHPYLDEARRLLAAEHALCAAPFAFPFIAYDGRYLEQQSLLKCDRAEAGYYYRPPALNADPNQIIAACCDPSTPAGRRPHRHGTVCVLLHANGSVTLER